MGGSCGGSTPEPQPKAQLGNVSSTSLSLTTQVGASTTSSFTFENTGDAALTYTLSETADFLAITSSPSGTVQPSNTTTVTLEASCTAEGTLNSTVSLTSNGGNAAVAVALTCTVPTPAERYDIDLQFVGDNFNAAREKVFEDAAARWSQIITGDQVDFTLEGEIPAGASDDSACFSEFDTPAVSGTIDDVLIFATLAPLDGKFDPDTNTGGLLGGAFPSYIRNPGNKLTFIGCMIFDIEDVPDLEADGSFSNVILHEMGHVFGIGSLWDVLGFLDYSPQPPQGCRAVNSFTQKPTFNGPSAALEYAAFGGTGDPPVEDGGGPGTMCAHWDEETLDNELMTGFLNPGVNPLSRLTIASLEDIGYEVNKSKADAYPSSLSATGVASKTGWEMYTPLVRSVKSNGKVIFFNETK
jgi:Leishmanolysin/Viral BACON domain